VFVRCFTDKTAIEDEIGEKLGYGLSRVPFAVIVVCVNPLIDLVLRQIASVLRVHLDFIMAIFSIPILMLLRCRIKSVVYGVIFLSTCIEVYGYIITYHTWASHPLTKNYHTIVEHCIRVYNIASTILTQYILDFRPWVQLFLC
jgi:hypothetical protein